MISMGIGSVLMALVLTVIISQGRLSTSVGNYEISHRENRIAIKQFESDIRHAKTLLATETRPNGYDEHKLKLEIITGLTREGEPIKSTITYKYDSVKKRLTRQQDDKPTRTIINDLASCKFNYFGLNDNPLPSTKNPTPSPSELRKVVISGTVTKGQKSRENKDYTISASVVIRKSFN